MIIPAAHRIEEVFEYSFASKLQQIASMGAKGFNVINLGIGNPDLPKSHNMAGWRIGWVSGNAEYINAILRVQSNVDSGMFLKREVQEEQA